MKPEINIMDVQPKNLHQLRYAIMSIWTGECVYAKHVHVFSDGVKLKSNCLNVFGTTCIQFAILIAKLPDRT